MDVQLLTTDFFTLFNMPRTYAVDVAALRGQYRALQAQVHPDRYAHASDREKRLALQYATHVNDAFATLKDPVRRARYLLDLNGTQSTDGNATIKDEEFLMDQMELRERLNTLTEDQTPAFLAEIDHRLLELERTFDASWQKTDDAALQKARTAVQKMQFLSKLRSEVDARF